MSLLQEYKELEQERLAAAEESKKHYSTANVPGDRVMQVDANAVRDRIATMAKVKALPNHDVKA